MFRLFFFGLLILVSACAAPSISTTVAPTTAPAAAPQPTATLTATPTSLPAATPTAIPLITVVPRAASHCPVTTLFKGDAPSDPNASPVTAANWYINADRTIWAGTVPIDGWHAGGNKTYWVRPAVAQLIITGRRLDAEAPPLYADVPCCYTSGFQIVGLDFPTEGCWEVNAKSGSSELQFVTEVKPNDHPAAGGSCATLADAVRLADAIVVGLVKDSVVDGHYAWLNLPVIETWKTPKGWSNIGDRFNLLQDLQSEPKLEQGKQYVLFIQYAPWKIVCAQQSLIEKQGKQAIPLGSGPLWSGGAVIDLKREIDRLLATR